MNSKQPSSEFWLSSTSVSADDRSRIIALHDEATSFFANNAEYHPDSDTAAHLRSVLDVLTGLQVDAATCLAIIMFTVNDECEHVRETEDGFTMPASLSEMMTGMAQQFPDAADIAQQLKQITQLENDYDPGKSTIEGLRRLLLALVNDVRVVTAAISDRLVHLREAVKQPGRHDRFVSLISAIHAPLANRLGVWQLKWELEDLVFRYQKPDSYQKIATLIDEKRRDREEYISSLVSLMSERLAKAGIPGQVKGRPKHIYSIWKKMSDKGRSFDELYDVRAIRILVDEVDQCYSVLGLVHAEWKPVPGEFDDYIANPKGNNYQSLHTAVFGPAGKTVEIQIRTHQMHEHAELGVAAHWQYKEGGRLDSHYHSKVNWMRHLLESGQDDSGNELLEEFSPGQNDERIYVLTPKGDVIDVRAGATVLDFAYHIHTDVGHRCRGAKVNGRIMPLDTELRHGQRVEILTANNAEPSRDWMVPRLGYLNSARARSKVRQWFKQKDRDRNIAEGREILDRELKRLAVKPKDLDDILSRFKLPDPDALYVAVGVHEITVGQIAAALQELAEKDIQSDDTLPLTRTPEHKPDSGGGVLIEGVGRLMTTMAGCCNPVPGDDIIGFITRTRGVSVHRSDCSNVNQLLTNEAERMIEVSWRNQSDERYQADIRITAYNRKGLIRDIGHILNMGGSDVSTMQTRVDEQQGEAEFLLSIRVQDFEHLSLLISRLQSMSNIIDVRRVG